MPRKNKLPIEAVRRGIVTDDELRDMLDYLRTLAQHPSTPPRRRAVAAAQWIDYVLAVQRQQSPPPPPPPPAKPPKRKRAPRHAADYHRALERLG